MTNNTIAVTCLDASRQQYGKRIAEELKLVVVPPTTKDYPILLAITSSRFELFFTNPEAPGPVYVDFLKGPLAYRRLFGGGRSQLIARAVGLKTYSNLSILDLTAGLGRDAFILANLGCNVTMLERHPIIATLLKEALSYAQRKAEWFQSLKLQLIETEARNYLLTCKTSYDVVYMDPMFPIEKKSALFKKEMRALRYVVGKDEDAPQVLEIALQKAKHRVVVKRPRLATKLLTAINPSSSYEGRSSRFDVYLTSQEKKRPP